MDWFVRIASPARPVKEANRPPAYVLERISMLEHAIKKCPSPRDAKKIIEEVIEALASQGDVEHIPVLTVAASRILDSRQDAGALVSVVVQKMLAERRKARKSKK